MRTVNGQHAKLMADAATRRTEGLAKLREADAMNDAAVGALESNYTTMAKIFSDFMSGGPLPGPFKAQS